MDGTTYQGTFRYANLYLMKNWKNAKESKGVGVNDNVLCSFQHPLPSIAQSSNY